MPDVFRGRGLARMKRGKYPEAAEDYSRALEHAPTADLYQHRGWAHFFADAWKGPVTLRGLGVAGMTGMRRRFGSALISRNASRPSFLGMFRSSRIRPGDGAESGSA